VKKQILSTLLLLSFFQTNNLLCTRTKRTQLKKVAETNCPRKQDKKNVRMKEDIRPKKEQSHLSCCDKVSFAATLILFKVLSGILYVYLKTRN